MALTAGTRLGSYEILALLGSGGMGEVYRARDTKLHREIALKVLAPDLARHHDAVVRFEREAQTASGLNHPHIVHIYDIGEAVLPFGPTHYIAMELVAGETVRARLRRGNRWSELVEPLAQAADALAMAHRAGIVHRDLKPENIMITSDGYAKVVDFGLAKLAEASAAVAGSDGEVTGISSGARTQAGMVVGTIGYMSPEQAEGQPTDGRSDIFSFGCVLYEVLDGRPPFKAASSLKTLHAILYDEPPSIESLNASVPAELCQIATKCLAKNPAQRYQAIGDVANDLRAFIRLHASSADVVLKKRSKRETESSLATARQPTGVAAPPLAASKPSSLPRAILWVAVALAVAVIAGAAFLYSRGPGERIDSMAVLPFVNSSGNPDTEYLTDGLTETLINSLSQLPGLRVTARSVAFRYKGRDVDPLKAGQDLNVRAVITGRVTTRGNMLIVQSDLVDVRNGSQLWGNQYNRPLADILAVQDEIAGEIFDKLRLRLTGEDKKRATKRYTEDAEAYQLYLRGRYYWNQGTIGGYKKAIEYFQQAINKDPKYALAYAGLADSYLFLGSYWVEAIPEAKVAALKALELDRTLAEAHVALGHIKLWLDWDWPAAELEFKQGIELNRNSALAHNQYAMYLAAMGRIDDAIAEVKRAQELDALSPIVNTDLGWYLLYAGRGGEAVEQFRKTLELDANYLTARLGLGASHAQQQLYSEAIDELKKAVSLSEGSPVPMGHLGFAYGLKGATAEARKTLSDLNTLANRQYVPASAVALVYAGLGDKAQTLDWLERAYQEHDFAMVFLDVAPWFKSVRGEPRFEQLRRRMQLPSRPGPGR